MPTAGQIKLIHTVLSEIRKHTGFSDDDYRHMLEDSFGVRSSKDLGPAQVDALLEKFKQLGWKERPNGVRKARPKPPADPAGPISPQQQEAIDALRLYLGMQPKAYQAFCKKRFGFWWPQTRRDGQKVVYAMTTMAGKRLYEDVCDLDRSTLTRWESGFLYENEPPAIEELARFAGAKGKRGYRTLPKVSITKLIEIIARRKFKQ